MSNRPALFALVAIGSILAVATLFASDIPQAVVGAGSSPARTPNPTAQIVAAPLESSGRLPGTAPNTAARAAAPNYWMMLVNAAGETLPTASIRVLGSAPASAHAVHLVGGTILQQPEEFAVASDAQHSVARDLDHAIASGDFAWISAPGFAPRSIQLEHGHDSESSAHRVQLDAGFDLQVTVLDADGAPSPGTVIRVSVSETDVSSVSATRPSRHDRVQRVDTWTKRSYASIGGSRMMEWIEPTDEAGIARFRALTTEASLRIDVKADDFVHESPSVAQGRAGESVRRTITLPALATLRGRLVDQHGNGIAYRPVWVLPTHSSVSKHYFSKRESPLRRGRTEFDGTFSIGEIPSGTYFVGLAPNEPEALEAERLPAVGLRVEVDGRTNTTLAIDRDLFLEAVTVDSSGNVVAGVRVLAVPIDASGSLQASSQEDGTVRVGPVQDGLFKLLASLSERACSATPVDVRVGEGPTLLQLTTGATGACVAIDGDTGEPRSVREVLVSEESGALRVMRFAPGNQGRFELADLPIGTTRLAISTWDGAEGRAQFEVTSSGPLEREIVIPTHAGGALEITNACLDQPLEVLVHDVDSLIVAVTRLAPGERKSVVVPGGELSLECQRPGLVPEFTPVTAAVLGATDFELDCP